MIGSQNMNEYFRKIYKNKKVLITGHTGFKGGWLSLWLTDLGANVIGYSLDPPTKPNLFESLNLKNKITHIIGDVRDEKHLILVFEKYQPEFVFHLAAQPIVRISYKYPKLTYETNILGTVNVLEAVRKTKSIEVCIMITSDKCYNNKEWVYGYRENDSIGGFDPYSSSKGCAELIITAYRNSFFNPKDYDKNHTVALSSVRAGNVIGGGDWREDRIVPDCIKMLSQKREIIIRNPNATRPWQYVLEPLNGYLLLGSKMHKDGIRYSSAWNFGPNDESIVTVNELVKLIIINWGSGTHKVNKSSNLYESGLLKLDISKARTLLGWNPVYNIYETIEKTVNWYRNFYNGIKKEKLFKISLNEIRDYAKHSNKNYNKYGGSKLQYEK